MKRPQKWCQKEGFLLSKKFFLEVWEVVVYIRVAKLGFDVINSINIFQNTGLSRSVPSLHRAWFSSVMGKPTLIIFL
jgi:hypothetical protein